MSWRIGSAIVLILLGTFIISAESKGVHVSLTANWESTPFLLEVAEFLAKEDKSLYINFLEEYYKQITIIGDDGVETFKTFDNDKDYIEFIVEIAKKELHNPERQKLLDLALATRLFSPAIIFNWEYSKQFIEEYKIEEVCGDKNKPFAFFQWTEMKVEEGVEEGQLQRNELHEIICDYSAIGQIVTDVYVKGGLDQSFAKNPFPVEHSKGRSRSQLKIFLFGDINTLEFKKYYEAASKALAEKSHTILIRYLPPQNYSENLNRENALLIQGYGAELDLKNMEYKAVDDSGESNVNVGEDIIVENDSEDYSELKEILKFSTLTRLKKSKLEKLGLQTSYLISQSDSPLELLSTITGNFPSLARFVSKVKVPEDFEKKEYGDNFRYVPSRPYLSLNGRYINPSSANFYEIYEMIQQELEIYRKFLIMDFSDEMSKKYSKFVQPYIPPTRYDLLDSNIVFWVNNLERDSRYASWPGSISEIVRPAWPNQLRFIKKNLINVIFVIDLNSISQTQVFPLLQAYVNGGAPIRFGVIFKTEENPNAGTERTGEADPISSIIATVFHHIASNRITSALNFLSSITYKVATLDANGSDLLSDVLKVEDIQDLLNEPISSYYTSVSDVDEQLKNSNRVLYERGFSDLERLGTLVNGIPVDIEISDSGLASAVLGLSNTEYSIIQSAYYNNLVKQDTNILEYLLSQYTSSKTVVFSSLASKYSQKIKELTPDTNDILFSVASPFYKVPELTSNILATKTESGMREYFNSFRYAHDHTNFIYSITHILILDLSTKQAMHTLENLANRYVDADGNTSFDNDDIRDVRFGFMNNIVDTNLNFEGGVVHYIYSNLFNTANRSLKSIKFLKFLQGLLHTFNYPDEDEKQVDVMQFMEKEVRPGLLARKNFLNYWKDQSFMESIRLVDRFVLEEIFKDKIQPGRNYVFTNGRLTLIPAHYQSLPVSFFKSIENEMRQKYKDVIADIIDNSDHFLTHYVPELSDSSPASVMFEKERRNKIISDVIFKTITQLELSSITTRSRLPSYLSSRGFSYSDDSLIHIHGSFDPLSKTACRIAPLLSSLEQHFGDLISVQYLPVPNLNITEFPLKSYYRYVLNTELQFDSANQYSPSNSFAAFTYLPTRPILTLGLDTPNSWLVQLSRSKYDLDNIILENVDQSFLFAEYKLENILVQGSCIDASGSPQGIQLRLSPSSISQPLPSSDNAVDTIVMANFGYYQLKGNPGFWNIDFIGRAKEIYDFYPNLPDEYSKDIYSPLSSISTPITSFLGYSSKQIFVQKKKGFESANVLDDSLSSQSDLVDIVDDYQHHLTQKNDTLSALESDDTIHVFSVASGHLYERFLKIMMLSVTKTTQSKVTFWILENYISPQFKSNFIPIFKEKYADKVNVRMVTYQWPSWLHAQTEKQRIIWAYKILFLDVLFPVDVKRIIFVDADLIVRSDLKELVELDMKGAPYGYTPFCDSRVEMEGFRFWKSGYWHNLLSPAGLKYHISALYVVDLERFRNIAAGDQLRYTYESLSSDPNSLSNLDQDLPNFVQHSLPIYSLPQEWLWCETWCSDDTKSSAKAIDLCNNPQTKMSKLEIANRIEGWTELDQEIKQLESSSNISASDNISSFQIGSSATVAEKWMKLTQTLGK